MRQPKEKLVELSSISSNKFGNHRLLINYNPPNSRRSRLQPTLPAIARVIFHEIIGVSSSDVFESLPEERCFCWFDRLSKPFVRWIRGAFLLRSRINEESFFFPFLFLESRITTVPRNTSARFTNWTLDKNSKRSVSLDQTLFYYTFCREVSASISSASRPAGTH